MLIEILRIDNVLILNTFRPIQIIDIDIVLILTTSYRFDVILGYN